MNIQDFLTYLLDAIACGFISLIVLDLGDGLSSNVLNTFVLPPPHHKAKDIPLAAKSMWWKTRGLAQSKCVRTYALTEAKDMT